MTTRGSVAVLLLALAAMWFGQDLAALGDSAALVRGVAGGAAPFAAALALHLALALPEGRLSRVGRAAVGTAYAGGRGRRRRDRDAARPVPGRLLLAPVQRQSAARARRTRPGARVRHCGPGLGDRGRYRRSRRGRLANPRRDSPRARPARAGAHPRRSGRGIGGGSRRGASAVAARGSRTRRVHGRLPVARWGSRRARGWRNVDRAAHAQDTGAHGEARRRARGRAAAGHTQGRASRRARRSDPRRPLLGSRGPTASSTPTGRCARGPWGRRRASRAAAACLRSSSTTTPRSGRRSRAPARPRRAAGDRERGAARGGARPAAGAAPLAGADRRDRGRVAAAPGARSARRRAAAPARRRARPASCMFRRDRRGRRAASSHRRRGRPRVH